MRAILSAAVIAFVSTTAQAAHPDRMNDAGQFQTVVARKAVKHGSSKAHRHVRHVRNSTSRVRHARARRPVTFTGIPGPLVAKVEELRQYCGASVISAHRPHARVLGSGKPSLHATGRAVDLVGNYPCMKARLADWPGGASTDYYRIGHLHISYAPGSREFGQRFAHWRPRPNRIRYARLR
jgi:hypothetical protein